MQALGLVVFGILPYAALAVGLGGAAWRLWRGLSTPQPWRAPLTPAPSRGLGVAVRLLWQGLALPTLRRPTPPSPRRKGAARWLARPARLGLWLLVGALHLCLLLVFLHHLRLVLQPVPDWLLALYHPGRLAGYLLPALLLLLLMRRLADPLLRHLSDWEDYLAPGLLLALCLSGLAMHDLARPPLAQIKALVLGLTHLSPAQAPPWGLFWLHFLLGLTLIIYLPWGKLIHGLGLFTSPALTQVDDPAALQRDLPWPAQTMTPPEDTEAAWGPEEYRAWLKRRWAGAGVHQVMGARQRSESLTGQRQWAGPGAEDER